MRKKRSYNRQSKRDVARSKTEQRKRDRAYRFKMGY